ncbi:MAG: DUF4178 domain-containing protein [Agriterribacter sp.]
MKQASSILQCPACSRVVSFIGTETNIKLCDVCGAVLHKKNTGELYTKTRWLVLEKNDIIQTGTGGKWNGENFLVLGRIRVWFKEAVFNYWTIKFDDGKECWLAEGYGIYALMRRLSSEYFSVQKIDAAKIGEKTFLPYGEFELQRSDKCERWEIEGEVWMPGDEESFRILEFAAHEGGHIDVFYFNKNNLVAFETTYTSFSDLQFSNLYVPAQSGKTFTCSQCSNSITLKAYPYSQSCACPSCNSAYTLNDNRDFSRRERYCPDREIRIPLGAKGIIKGIEYEVIGFAEKEERNAYHSQWREYTLYNRNEGFAFLSEYDGHWIYVRETSQAPVLPGLSTRSFQFGNEPFQLFNGYSYKIKGAAGEFPYNAFNNGNLNVREYISPPEMWIMEKSPKEGFTWFLGEHIRASAISNTFEPCFDLPQQFGVGAVQSKGYVNPIKLIAAAAIAVLLLILLHGWTTSQLKEKTLLNQAYVFNDTSNVVTVVTEKFFLDKSSSNLLFKIAANVNNTWFELNATLVDAGTGKEYSLEKGVEYYHGYSGGEYWSEGNNREQAYLTNIPKGTYFLTMLGMREQYSSEKLREFYVEVLYDVPSSRNLVFALLLVLAWPVGKFFLVSYNEASRWSNSPYSDYEK